jgi:hypothetical protein
LPRIRPIRQLGLVCRRSKAHPTALASRIGGFVQARNWFQDYTSITLRSS